MASTTGFKARVEYEVTDGTQTTYTFPFSYLRKKFVMVSILHSDGTETTLEYGVDYTVNDLSVSLTIPAQVGEHLIIYRQTSTDGIITWNDGSILLARDMNTEDAQMLHLQEEQQDYITANAISTKVTSDKEIIWDALNHRISNVSDPKDPQDAVTKHYMENVQGGFVSANTILVQEATKQASAAKASQESAKASATQASDSERASLASANLAEAWATSTTSPDNIADAESATGKTQSSRTWALFSKSKAQEASTSATNAKASENNAKSSETKAAVSATNAKTSETNAKTSARTASDSASASASSASASATSATKAKASETKALSSEQNAKTSETNAKDSETNASSSAESAYSSETNALASELNAKRSEQNAKTSETNAKTSETNAKTSETNAKTSETNASDSEMSARASEINARVSETNAAESARIATEHAMDFNMWKRNKAYSVGDIAFSSSLPSWAYLECTTAGTTGNIQPYVGTHTEIQDGSAVFKVRNITELVKTIEELRTIQKVNVSWDSTYVKDVRAYKAGHIVFVYCTFLKSEEDPDIPIISNLPRAKMKFGTIVVPMNMHGNNGKSIRVQLDEGNTALMLHYSDSWVSTQGNEAELSFTYLTSE